MVFLLTILFVILNHLRDNLFYRTVDYIIGNGVDRSVFVVVDGDDDTALLHSGDVLDLSADAASDVEFRTDGNTGLTNLTVMVGIACIDAARLAPTSA